jgi:N utilization substance protein B
MKKSSVTDGGVDIGGRQKARHYTVQALYQWILAGATPAQIEAEFRADNDMSVVDTDYFHDVFTGTVRYCTELDAIFAPLLDRAVKDLDPVTLGQLRMATYEFRSRQDVPWLVILGEAIRLSKKFGPTDSFKFLNGVLEKVAHQLRPVETGKT